MKRIWNRNASLASMSLSLLPETPPIVGIQEQSQAVIVYAEENSLILTITLNNPDEENIQEFYMEADGYSYIIGADYIAGTHDEHYFDPILMDGTKAIPWEGDLKSATYIVDIVTPDPSQAPKVNFRMTKMVSATKDDPDQKRLVKLDAESKTNIALAYLIDADMDLHFSRGTTSNSEDTCFYVWISDPRNTISHPIISLKDSNNNILKEFVIVIEAIETIDGRLERRYRVEEFDEEFDTLKRPIRTIEFIANGVSDLVTLNSTELKGKPFNVGPYHLELNFEIRGCEGIEYESRYTSRTQKQYDTFME